MALFVDPHSDPLTPAVEIKKILLTSMPGSRWQVVVNETVLQGEHNEEKEAMERALNIKIETPEAEVFYQATRKVKVDLK